MKLRFDFILVAITLGGRCGKWLAAGRLWKQPSDPFGLFPWPSSTGQHHEPWIPGNKFCLHRWFDWTYGRFGSQCDVAVLDVPILLGRLQAFNFNRCRILTPTRVKWLACIIFPFQIWCVCVCGGFNVESTDVADTLMVYGCWFQLQRDWLNFLNVHFIFWKRGRKFHSLRDLKFKTKKCSFETLAQHGAGLALNGKNPGVKFRICIHVGNTCWFFVIMNSFVGHKVVTCMLEAQPLGLIDFRRLGL